MSQDFTHILTHWGAAYIWVQLVVDTLWYSRRDQAPKTCKESSGIAEAVLLKAGCLPVVQPTVSKN